MHASLRRRPFPAAKTRRQSHSRPSILVNTARQTPVCKKGMHRDLCRLEDVTNSLARCQGATRSLLLGTLPWPPDRLESGLHHLVVRFLSSPRREYNVETLGLLVHLFLQCLDCPMFVLALSACPRLHVVGDCGMACPFRLPVDLCGIKCVLDDLISVPFRVLYIPTAS